MSWNPDPRDNNKDGEIVALNGDYPNHLHPWERQPGESSKAFEAFECYRGLGASRSLLKVSQQLVKSTTLLSRWSVRHCWVERCRLWDAHEAQSLNAALLRGKVAMRQRMATQGADLQKRGYERVANMRREEIDDLSTAEACLLLKTGTEMERTARDIDEREAGFAPGLQPPVFTIQVIRPGAGMVAVQINGRYGYIPKDQVERFRRENPDAVVIV